MKKEERRSPRISLSNVMEFRWLLLIGALVIVGAVMSFGLVAALGLDLHRKNALLMLAMIPPMLGIMYLCARIVVHSVGKKLNRLLDGIQSVADGDLNTHIDTKGAEEYAVVYEQFNRMVDEVRHTKEQMTNFVNEFSHEFKTPITAIHGFAELLADSGEGIETPERMEYLRVIADESLRLSELSQKTLLLSKVEACQILTDKQEFDLGEQLKRCAIMMLPQMEKKHITPDIDVEGVRYRGNPEWMEQVWMNLLSNAVKFTPEQGEIGIRAKQEGNAVMVEIADTGIGMDEATASRIFDKYYQHDSQNAVRGNGIGLSIVKRIIELCGGSIRVRSAPGEGSTFMVTLP